MSDSRALATAFKVGDVVRVSAARRRDIHWTVTEVADQIVVAVNGVGGEIRYDAGSLEHVEPDSAGTEDPTISSLVPVTTPYRRSAASTSAAPAECRDGCIVRPKPGQPIDNTLKDFKKAVARSGILRQWREREFFIPKSERRRSKSIQARDRRSSQDAVNLERSRNL